MERSDCLLELIKHQKPGDVRRFLKEIPTTDRSMLQIGGMPLLNVAARHKRGDMMACLFELGFSSWQQCDEGSQFFLDTLKGYLRRDLNLHFPKFFEQSRLLKCFAKFFKLFDKSAPDKTTVVQDLLKQHPTWSMAMFRRPFALKTVIVEDRCCSDEIFDAIQEGRIEDLRKLLEKPQLNVKTRDRPLLNIAAEKEQSETMALLIQYGAREWIYSEASNEFFATTLEIVTKKDVETVFPDLNRRSGLGKAFDIFFRGMRHDTQTTTRLVQEILKLNPGWLVSMLCRPALAFIHPFETGSGWYDLLLRWRNPSPRRIVLIGYNISWSLHTLDIEFSARDRRSSRPLFMDQVLITEPTEVALPNRGRESNLSVIELSGTTKDVLEQICIVYKRYIEDNGYSFSFEGLDGFSNGSYFLTFGT